LLCGLKVHRPLKKRVALQAPVRPIQVEGHDKVGPTPASPRAVGDGSSPPTGQTPWGIATLAMALDPQIVIIGGGLMDPEATAAVFRER
jgi:hypothetical protein